MTKLRDRLPSIALAITMVLSAGAGLADPPAPVPEIGPGVLQGYLAKEGLPDSAALLPPPPALGSAGLALDQEVGRTALAMRDSPRWKLAAMDADLTFPNAAGTFSCVLGAPVTEQDTPHLYQMLRRVLTDAGLATYAAKDKYQHARPFMLDDQPICTPDKDKSLRMQGSYPSGHASAGWAWALVLAEASPGQSDAIFARGLAFGQSRLVCNVHWESDVIEGRTIGAATVARVHANPAFLADLAAAKDELAAVRAKQLPPQRDCAFEAAALAQTLPQVP
jgi:acid phosphatase (class A)